MLECDTVLVEAQPQPPEVGGKHDTLYGGGIVLGNGRYLEVVELALGDKQIFLSDIIIFRYIAISLEISLVIIVWNK